MKAILVIDMPKKCDECPCFYDWLRCQAKDGLNVLGDEIPKGCPLKSMPRKMAVEHRWYSEDFAKGYNLCVDEITGEKE